MEYCYLVEPKEGQTHSGDGVIVFEEENYVRIITVDSLGHGERAQKVVDTVRSLDDDLRHKRQPNLMRYLHGKLRNSRGAAISIADIYKVKLDWCAVGNVEIKADDSSVNPINDPGIVGYKIRKLQQRTFEVGSGTLMIIHSDGISSRFTFEEDVPVHRDVEYLARFIMNNYRKPKDDATVVVVRT